MEEINHKNNSLSLKKGVSYEDPRTILRRTW